MSANRVRRSPSRRWTVRILLLVLAAWLVASGVVLWGVRARTNAGLDALDRTEETLDAAELLRGGGASDLVFAESEFADAHDLATNPILTPWRIVPLLGGNVSSVAAMTAAAADVAAIGARVSSAAAAVVAQQPADGAARLALLAELERISANADRALARLDLGNDFFLIGPVGEARRRFLERLIQLRRTVADAQTATAGTQTLLQGPRRYLVLAANNAEMRAGSGMLLSAGVATFADGGFSLGEMAPTQTYGVPGGVPLPAELATLWGFTPMGRDWRYLAMSPRFEATAPVAADMWAAATGEVVDGVLLVDPVTLEALLAAQGPVEAGGRELGADDVLGYLLLGQYEGLSNENPDQSDRRDQLSVVARAGVDTLTTRAWDVDALVRELGDAGAGRHLLAWARDPEEQRTWVAAGIDGALEAASLAPNVLNTGGNKLDQFLHVGADLALAARADGGQDATLTLTLRNQTPEGLGSYVAGPHPSTGLAEGEYQGILTVNTPGFGTLATIEGVDPIAVSGIDGPTKVVGGFVRVLRGETRTATVRFTLPPGVSSLRIEPSARVPPIAWSARGQEWSDTAPYHLEW